MRFVHFLFLASAWPLTASANCSTPSSITQHWRAQQMANGQCRCVSDTTTQKYLTFTGEQLQVLSGQSLQAICGVSLPDLFYFKGRSKLSGHVIRMSTVTFGDHTFFSIKERQQPDGFNEFRFDRPQLLNQLHTPKLTKLKNCWSAPATIEVLSFNVDFDSNDSSGAYIQSYKLLNIGPYKQCEGESDS